MIYSNNRIFIRLPLFFFILFSPYKYFSNKTKNQVYFALACPQIHNFSYIFFDIHFSLHRFFYKWKAPCVRNFIYFDFYKNPKKKEPEQISTKWLFWMQISSKTKGRKKKSLKFCFFFFSFKKQLFEFFANFTIVRVTRLDFDEALQHCAFLAVWNTNFFLSIRYIHRATPCQYAHSFFVMLYRPFLPIFHFTLTHLTQSHTYTDKHSLLSVVYIHFQNKEYIQFSL